MKSVPRYWSTVRSSTWTLSMVFGLFALWPLAAMADEWVAGLKSSARLEAGGLIHDPLAGEQLLFTGLSIGYEEGWKTYWRNPGDAGIGPHFDWSGSINLARAEVQFPAPHAFFDGYANSIGYGGQGVTLPVRLVPEDPSRPIVVSLAVNYAVCAEICVPEQVELSAFVRPQPVEGRGQIEVALAERPVPANDLKVVATASENAIIASIHTPARDGLELFAEGPDREPMLVPVRMEGDADWPQFQISLEGLAAELKQPGTVYNLTLVAPDGAWETTLSLDP